jgi:putative transposase
VVVHSAGVQDRDGARLVVKRLRQLKLKLKIIWADQGYAGQLADWVWTTINTKLEVVKKLAGQRGQGGFVPIPKRWIVERTFAWLGNYRRLSKNYECREDTAETFVRLAMIHIMTRRLCPKRVF